MEREKEILNVTRELVAIPSVSDTDQEHLAAEYIKAYFQKQSFFTAHPEYTGTVVPEDDYRKRPVVFAFVPGATRKTLVLMGHMDVVATADFGPARELAFDCDHVKDYLRSCELDEDSRRDLDSGQWLFGRGTCDMKGGLAAAMVFTGEYAAANDKPGSLLFLAVPDEESYSAGMRGAGRLLLSLKETYALDFELLVDPEPNFREKQGQIVPIGSAGKCMPVILVQGAKAHISKCFEGLNPMGIMGEIFSRTELSLDFTDSCDGEITVPPTWLWLKDMKEEYDVSIPLRVSGYINMISFTSTPEEILDKLIPVCREAFRAYVDKMKVMYADYQKQCKYPSSYRISWEPAVMTLEELTGRLKQEKGDAYDTFMKELYEEITAEIHSGSLNYPQATIYMMDRLLTWSGITKPLVLLGFAPPYYPAVRSDHIKGKEQTVARCLKAASDMLKEQFGYGLVTENYTVGLSDISYTSLDKEFNYVKYSHNTLLWGQLYSIDFDVIRQISMPGLILGPWGKDFHKMTERVNIQSLTREYPLILQTIADQVWYGLEKHSD